MTVTNPTDQAQGSWRNQAQDKNPLLAPHMHIGKGFRIINAIVKAVADRVYKPMKDDSQHFCLSYHLKVVCNTNCGGQNLHRPMLWRGFGGIVKWRNRYCGRDKAPPVREVNIGGRSQALTPSDQTGRPRGPR